MAKSAAQVPKVDVLQLAFLVFGVGFVSEPIPILGDLLMPADSRSTSSNIYPCLYYRDASAAIEWLCRAFGFVKRMAAPGPDGTIAHAELSFGEGVVMVASSKPEQGWVSPRDLPAVNQAISVYVEDPDAHFARARLAGAEITRELRDEEYGARGYLAKDPEGNHWYFGDYRPGAYWSE